jgi:hypothetical protein
MKLPVEQLILIKYSINESIEKLQSSINYNRSLLRTVDRLDYNTSDILLNKILRLELDLKETKELQDLLEKVASITVKMKDGK